MQVPCTYPTTCCVSPRDRALLNQVRFLIKRTHLFLQVAKLGTLAGAFPDIDPTSSWRWKLDPLWRTSCRVCTQHMKHGISVRITLEYLLYSTVLRESLPACAYCMQRCIARASLAEYILSSSSAIGGRARSEDTRTEGKSPHAHRCGVLHSST